jgi:hypothetical protein
MYWDRRKSISEQLMIDILTKSNQPLLLDEIVKKILVLDPSALTGKTPMKSLYSVIYRREKRRTERGTESLFEKTTRGGATYYTLNPKGIKNVKNRMSNK